MRRNVFGILAAGFGLLLASAPLLAHHSFAAEYDSKKPIKITGTRDHPSFGLDFHHKDKEKEKGE